jgi:HAE1 family hydrophobic/amphiphilic exporter-1
MLASTCLAVLFVPSLFVVIQRFEEWISAPKTPKVEAPKVEASKAGAKTAG